MIIIQVTKWVSKKIEVELQKSVIIGMMKEFTYEAVRSKVMEVSETHTDDRLELKEIRLEAFVIPKKDFRKALDIISTLKVVVQPSNKHLITSLHKILTQK